MERSKGGCTALANVHVGVPLAKRSTSIQAIVNGDYRFFHFGHHATDDRGWGCAYRSGQTLFSWVQGKLNIRTPIPTNLKMQQHLHQCGDKPKNFVGSRQWIGSIEISLLLHEMYGVTCQFLQVPAMRSADHMYNVAQELVQHFQTSGAPVMCGGSTGRAITLLGVRITSSHPVGGSTTKSHPLSGSKTNSHPMGADVTAEPNTNASIDSTLCTEHHTKPGDNKNGLDDVQISFLALDPHYFGPDKLPLVQTRPWCYWAAADVVLLRSHTHNLVLPNTPSSTSKGVSGMNIRKISAVEAAPEGVSRASVVTNETEWVFELIDTDSD